MFQDREERLGEAQLAWSADARVMLGISHQHDPIDSSCDFWREVWQ